MESTIISIDNVCKVFGKNIVLDHVSITFEKNKIHGLVGRNGSGKTMLLKCICGFVPVTSGKIIVDGKCIGQDTDVPEDIGIIIETPGFLPNYSGYKNLKFLASIKRRISKDEIKNAIHRVGLDPESKKHVGKYSLGMRQRLGIAQAIMEHPSILILDEPMNGLDKHGVKDVRELLIQLRNEGVTILLASHNIQDIDMLCDTVCEMDAGQLTAL